MPEKDLTVEMYYEELSREAPSPSLIDAINHVANRNNALDFGSGPGRDTRVLLEQFTHVDALDGDTLASKYLGRLPQQDRLQIYTMPFSKFSYPSEHYDLINAQRSIPLVPQAEFPDLFDKLKSSLARGGILVGDLWGNEDSASSSPVHNVHSKDEVLTLLSDMEVIYFNEMLGENKTRWDTITRNHSFKIIARKK